MIASENKIYQNSGNEDVFGYNLLYRFVNEK